MARCNDCNKFVSYGDPEIEISSEQVDEDLLTAEIRIALTCAECSAEIKEAVLDFEQDIDHECEEKEIDEPRYEVLSSSAEGNSRMETTGKNGKPIKARYARTYYGADLTFDVQCAWCDETFTVGGDVEEQASGFEEL